MTSWHPDSWREFSIKQQPTYPDSVALKETLGQLRDLPPLVTPWEVETLKRKIAEAQRGEAFLLQGGDCAENFTDCRADLVLTKLKILLQMSLVLLHGLDTKIVRVGRLAGQYTKPRSADTETRDGITLPSYRGDLVNSEEFTEAGRLPDPVRLLRGHGRAAMTLNLVRALSDCGFADLHHPENWDLDFVKHSPQADEYHRVVEALASSLRFAESLGGASIHELSRIDFYTSHEALHLEYEQALTRTTYSHPGWYNLGTHLPWIGLRTAQMDSAHLELMSGIRNPVGIKVGAEMDAAWLQGVVDKLNPNNEAGKLVLIHRFGVDKIEAALPPMIEAVRATGKQVLWMADPMHGNTHTTSNGYKSRRFDDILGELTHAMAIHQRLDSHLGGVHFEMTGEDVTECTGGARGLDEEGLTRAYRTQVDPRLNYEQALEMAMAIVRTAKG